MSDKNTHDGLSSSQLTPTPLDSSTKILLSKSVAQRLSYRLVALTLGGVILIHLQSIMIPLVLGILLAFLLTPAVGKMTLWGFSQPFSIVSAQLMALIILLGVIMAFSTTIGPLSRAMPKYREALLIEVNQSIEWVGGMIDSPDFLKTFKREMNEEILPKVINQGIKITQSGLSATTSLLGYFFLTLLLSTFILLEGHHLKEKLTEAYDDHHPLLMSLGDIGEDVRAYVVAKTLISLVTSVAVWIVLSIAQVDFALFWALLAFPLNFIPTVGAIAASLPPIVIAMIDPELNILQVSVVAIGLGLVNGFIGSVIDPRYVGQKVKLSPLVVLLSMLFWGVLWGPIGMILAVPIMVSVKVIFSHTAGLEQISIIMRG